MSEIVQTEAVVLTKIDFGDTSNIVHLYTKTSGRIPVIVKGVKSPKSKIGRVLDPLNHVNIIFYKKAGRELQLLSSAELVDYHSKTKEDFDKLRYSLASIEFINKLTMEGEENSLIFKGILRILKVINDHPESEYRFLFLKYVNFLIKEIGYQFQTDKCSACGTTSLDNKYLGYNFETGLLCDSCKIDNRNDFNIETELFRLLICLNRKDCMVTLNDKLFNRAYFFLENYIKFHVPTFNGIQSLQIK